MSHNKFKVCIDHGCGWTCYWPYYETFDEAVNTALTVKEKYLKTRVHIYVLCFKEPVSPAEDEEFFTVYDTLHSNDQLI